MGPLKIVSRLTKLESTLCSLINYSTIVENFTVALILQDGHTLGLYAQT